MLALLEKFLSENKIPVIKKKPLTFLGIAKQPHYENVLSNIYAFFFNVNEEHSLGDLFIKSFIELIAASELGKKKTGLQDFSNFKIHTEYSTIANGRIDLLLENSQQAIIIENKVKHHIEGNDLVDYWKTIVKENACENGYIGVILSLKAVMYSHKLGSEKFINITHQQLMQQVMRNSGPYLIESKDKYIVFLKDFAQNIYNLSTPTMKKEDFEFYIKNQKAINSVIKISEIAREHITQQINEVIPKDNKEFTLNQSSGNLKKILRYFVSRSNPNIMFTIIYAGLLTPIKELKIIVELQNKALNNKEQYADLKLSSEENKHLVNNFTQDKNKKWAHFATKTYVLNDDEIYNLTDFLISKLEEDQFFSLVEKIVLLLKEEKGVINH